MYNAPGLMPNSPPLIATVIVRSQSLLHIGGEADVDSTGGWRMQDVGVEHKKRGDDTSSFSWDVLVRQESENQ